MEVSAVKKVVEKNVQRFIDYFGLNQWHIEITYKRLRDGVAGSCEVKPGYMRAYISIDNDQVETADYAAYMLRHELIHVFLWPMFEHASVMLNVPGAEGDALTRVWEFHHERMVKEIEMMLDRASECPCVLPAKTKAKRKKRR